MIPGCADGEILTAIRHIDQLLALDDEAFVEALFVTILKRPPDSAEMKFYVNQLRAGYGKAETLADIAKFPEGTAGLRDLPGSQGFVGSRRWSRGLPWGLLSRGRRMERQLNRLENGIGQLLQQLNRLESETTRQLSELKQSPQVAPESHGEPTADPVGESARADASDLSKPARQILQKIYDELEAARGQTFN